MKTQLLWQLLLISLVSCIGTDYLDDPKDSAILTNVTSASLETGATFQIEAVYYYNMWVAEPSATLFWRSKNAGVATVNQTGLVSGVSKGQTQIEVWYPDEDTVTVLVTVVSNLNDVSDVLISSPTSSIDVNESINLSIEVYNLNGEPFAGEGDTLWTVSDETVATIDQDGLLTGIGDGRLDVMATVAGVSSEPLPIMVGLQARTGTLQGVGSYQAIGTATLYVNENEELMLELSDNFTTSFALGTFAYLANSTDGSVVRAQGLEIAEIKENGGKLYNVSAINPDVELYDYRYVIILCKPASITFGYADLN